MREPVASGVESRRADRGVTEVLGYVVIFALIIAAVGFVSVLGMPSLESVQETEQASNAERAFDVVGDNMAAIYERNAPSRATEIDLGGSEIYYDKNVTMTVDVGGDRVETELRPVALRVSDDSTLVFEGGALIRDEGDGGFLLREPPLVLENDRVHIPVVQTTAPAIESAGGTTVLLRGESAGRTVALSDRTGGYSGDTIEVNVTSPRYEVWERYFQDETALSSCTTGDGWVQCEMTSPDVVFVTVQRIEVSLIL